MVIFVFSFSIEIPQEVYLACTDHCNIFQQISDVHSFKNLVLCTYHTYPDKKYGLKVSHQKCFLHFLEPRTNYSNEGGMDTETFTIKMQFLYEFKN